MLTHQYPVGKKPNRVVILGATGFIGAVIRRRLSVDGIKTLAVGRADLDLLAHDAPEKLAECLDDADTLVFASARAPCKDLTMLLENTRMLQSVCAALKQKSVAHLVYISSDAVYKDSAQLINEASCAEPGVLHGVMHLTREVALRNYYSGPLAIVRPTLVYGYDDPHNGYGPNRFRRLAAAGREILLFGEGEELRDHVDVEDIGELVRLIILHRSSGIANAVSGEVVSFRELAEYTVSAFSPSVPVKRVSRQTSMPHNGYRGFDNAAVLQAFPGFRFKSWRDGVSAVCQRYREEQTKV